MPAKAKGTPPMTSAIRRATLTASEVPCRILVLDISAHLSSDGNLALRPSWVVAVPADEFPPKV